MFLAEPPRTQYDFNFVLAGIPVRVHPFFWLVSLLMGAGAGEMSFVLIWAGVVFVSILVHEMGHAFAMRYYGWSPRVVLYAFGGLATYDQGFSGSSSSYSRKGNRPNAQIIISAAGPAAGFLFAGLVILALYLFGRTYVFYSVELGRGPSLNNLQLFWLVHSLLFVNIFWGLVNLAPIYPLDGGQISRELFLKSNVRDAIRQSLILSIAAAIAIAIYGLTVWEEIYVAFFFGYLAFSSYQLLQRSSGGYGGGRPW